MRPDGTTPVAGPLSLIVRETTMKKYIKLLILSGLVAINTTSHASSEIPKLCLENLNQQLPEWSLAKVSDEVQSYGVFKKFNPVIASGDFDGNGLIDKAILVEHNEKRKVGVCLQEKEKVKLLIIQEPYCHDYVITTKSESKLYNYDTTKNEFIKNDSISVACFERAGATYVYEDGELKIVVSSD